MVARLLAAKNVTHADGHTKARDLLERLRDFDQIEPAQAEKLVEAVTATSPTLLAKEDEPGIVALPNRWRTLGLVADLLERLPRTERQAVLLRLAGDSPALHSVVGLADMALRAKRDPSKAHKAMVDLDDDFADALAAKVGARLNASTLEALLASPEMDFVVHRWSQWGDASLIPPIFEPMLADDGRLLALIDKFVRTGLAAPLARVRQVLRHARGAAHALPRHLPCHRRTGGLPEELGRSVEALHPYCDELKTKAASD